MLGPAENRGTRMPEISPARRTWLLIVCCSAVGLVMATMTGLYPVAPDIARHTGATQTEITWIVDAYVLAIAGLLLPAGAISDRYGRRGTLIAGLAIYCAGALMLVVVDTPGQLIAGRVVLGIGAAVALPSTLSLITSIYPKESRDTAVALWTASFGTAGGFGAFASSGLLEFFDWRSPLWMLLIGGVVVLLAAMTVPTTTDPNPPPVDIPGALTGALSISALVYALIQAGLLGWSSPWIIGAVVVGLGSAVLFAVIQLRRRHPLLDVRVFAIRPFAASTLAVMASFAAVYGLYYLALQYQQYVLGFSAFKAAVPAASMAIGVFSVTIASNYLTRVFGLRAVTALGCLGGVAGFGVLLTGDGGSSYLLIFSVFTIMGVATGLNMAPCTSAILRYVPAAKQGVAAAVNHTTREMGTALGVALIGGVLSAGYRDSVREATAGLPEPARDASRESVAAAMQIAEQSGPAGDPLADAANAGFVAAMHDVCWVMICVLGACAVLVWFWQPSRKQMSTMDAALDSAPSLARRAIRGVSGWVRGADGTPLVGVGVTLTDLDGNQLGRTVTDEGGGYVVESAVPGRHLVVCSSPGFTPDASLVPLNGVPARNDVVLVRAVSGLAGTVRTEHGTPVAGAAVRVHGVHGNLLAATASGPDGGYRFDSLPAGTHTLSVSHRREGSRRIRVPGDTAADLDVTR